MTKWEYIIEESDKGVIWLNRMGSEGWELCGVETIDSFKSRYFFKRPIPESKQEP